MIRRLVVALIVASIVAPLAGCGGGGGGEAPPADAGAPATGTEASPTAPAPAAGVTDRSAPEDATVFEPFPQATGLPEAITDRIADRQPMAILFVDGSQQVTDEVRSALDDAIKANGGAIDLVVYDLGKYVSLDASGQALVDTEKFAKDPKAPEAIALAAALKVGITPYIIMTDDQGYVVFRHRGLVDRAFLEMHMERLVD